MPPAPISITSAASRIAGRSLAVAGSLVRRVCAAALSGALCAGADPVVAPGIAAPAPVVPVVVVPLAGAPDEPRPSGCALPSAGLSPLGRAGSGAVAGCVLAAGGACFSLRSAGAFVRCPARSVVPALPVLGTVAPVAVCVVVVPLVVGVCAAARTAGAAASAIATAAVRIQRATPAGTPVVLNRSGAW
jgi:hypothetical protein